MKKLLLSALTVSLMLVSCGKDDDTTQVQQAQKECPKAEKGISISTSPTGVFSDIAFVQSKMSSNPQLAKEVFDSFKDKLAVSSRDPAVAIAIRQQLGDWISEINSSTVTATQGTAGKLGNRYVNAKGLELEQLVKKGLIGAYQLSTALSVTSQIAFGNPNKDEQKKLFDKFVTALIGSPAYLEASKGKINNHKKVIDGYPEMAGNEFAKYLNTVSSNPTFATLSDDLYATLKDAKGKVGNKEELGDALKKARDLAVKVVAIRCVHYLLEVSKDYEKATLTKDKAHGISEGLGFYYSLQFTYGGTKTGHKPYVTHKEVEDLLANLDLWDTTTTKTKLETIAEKLATTFEFKADDAKN